MMAIHYAVLFTIVTYTYHIFQSARQFSVFFYETIAWNYEITLTKW